MCLPRKHNVLSSLYSSQHQHNDVFVNMQVSESLWCYDVFCAASMPSRHLDPLWPGSRDCCWVIARPVLLPVGILTIWRDRDSSTGTAVWNWPDSFGEIWDPLIINHHAVAFFYQMRHFQMDRCQKSSGHRLGLTFSSDWRKKLTNRSISHGFLMFNANYILVCLSYDISSLIDAL